MLLLCFCDVAVLRCDVVHVHPFPPAFQRLISSGCIITTAESCIFELLGDAKHPQFKAIVPLVKELAQTRAQLPAPSATTAKL